MYIKMPMSELLDKLVNDILYRDSILWCESSADVIQDTKQSLFTILAA